MKRILFACLASMMLFAAPTSANAHEVKSKKYYEQYVANLKETNVTLKKEIMEYCPEQFPTINSVTTSYVKKASEKLSGGSMLDMKQSVYMEIAYKKVQINDIYANGISVASKANVKQMQVDDYEEYSAWVKNMAEVMGELSALDNFGGSMAGLEYAAAELNVYEAWFNMKTKGSSMRVTSAQAKAFVAKMRSTCDEKYKSQMENFDGEDMVDALKQSKDRVTKAIDNLEALFQQKAPGKWLVDTFVFEEM